MAKNDKKSAEIRELRPNSRNTQHTRSRSIRPPSHLSKEAGGWWGKITDEYEISDEAGLLLLQTALEAFDRMRGAQRIVKREGMAPRTRLGEVRAHPALMIERDARGAMLKALAMLNLDVEPLGKPGRPGGR